MDSFTIPFHIMVRGTKEEYKNYVDGLLRQYCVCNHIAAAHFFETIKHVNIMCDEIRFVQCKVRCSCRIFKRDNLRYLENLLNEKAS